jgi:Fe2+-dicitrate sensor, membrane component
MNSLQQKYRNDELTAKELQKLRVKVNSMSNDEIAKEMFESWMNEDLDVSKVSQEQMCRVKERIDSVVATKHFSYTLLYKIAKIAAAVLLPVFIISTFYLYKENNELVSEEMVVSTGKGERASITLPDGTKVMLNSESRLGYTPKVYNKEKREINFDGEGYFQVSKDKKCPFLIDAVGLQVKVLGTTFNLSVCKHDSTAELDLEEGSVLFTSLRTGANVVLKPNQRAVLNQSTGKISLVTDKDIQNISAWVRGDLIFHNTELVNVIHTIENNYGVHIKVKCNNCLSDLFTGTLSNTDLNQVLEVLEKSYHLKARKNGNNIILELKIN